MSRLGRIGPRTVGFGLLEIDVEREYVPNEGRILALFNHTLLEFLREGDELVVTRVDRLARSIRALQNIVYDLEKRGVTLSATELPIDTKTSAEKCFLDMLGVFGEFETNLRKERQMEGIAKAKEKGVYKGRKPSVDVERVKALRDSDLGASAIAKEMGIGRASVYRALG